MKWKPLLQQVTAPEGTHHMCPLSLLEVLQSLKSLAAESGYHMAMGLDRCTQRCSGLRFGLGVQVMWVRSLLWTAWAPQQGALHATTSLVSCVKLSMCSLQLLLSIDMLTCFLAALLAMANSQGCKNLAP